MHLSNGEKEKKLLFVVDKVDVVHATGLLILSKHFHM